MLEWWDSLGIAAQIFYCIAIPSTLIIIIQTILLMVGMGGGGEGVNISDTSGIDGNLDGGIGDMGDISDLSDGNLHGDITDGSNPSDFGTMQLFTLQGIMTFLCVFGWSGVICAGFGLHIAVTVIISVVLGFLAMLGVAKILQLTRKLTQSGNIELNKLLGEKASVYIPIPAKGEGQGKVTVATGERFVEFGAITDEEEAIPTGTQVRVTDIRGDLLAVEKDTN